ncbi:hypothetical protein [Mucilaginibacter gilvus]|uniref:Uncharacterized protein n=1 Tax=Mucilaginibacter gilvus TaxID=2305909 RepID=A0A444MU84_9SPHI|nr:hypothetical protein [Mucilaginibacter gilvus]RWY57169.1 hypothetical protein EPL05_01140 [Mucilaginibacter gilvus]
MMEQEYTISRGWKIFYGLVSLASFAFGAFLASKISTASSLGGAISGSILLIGVGIVLGLYLVRRKVVLSNDSISVSGILGTRTFANYDVKGFRVEEKAILIYSIAEGRRRIMINDYDSLGDNDGLITELSERYTDLNAEEYESQLTDILQSNEFGLSEDERMNSLRSAGKLALAYNLLGIIGLIICFFFLDAILSSDIYSVVAMIYPLVGIAIMSKKKGLIKFAAKKTSPVYSIYYSMFMSCVFLVVKPLVKYHLVEISQVWLPMGGIAIIFFCGLYWKGKADAANAIKGQVVLMIITALGYSCGSTITVNCLLIKLNRKYFLPKWKMYL